MKFNENGLIEPGLHGCTIAEVNETFVDKFPSSQRRAEIFDSLINFIRGIAGSYKIHEIWIDGSFVTEKINPNDVDIIIFFELDDFLKISRVWSIIRKVKNIDAYCSVAVIDDYKKRLSPQEFGQITNKRNYWRGQFGFDRSDRPKGIIVLSIDAINEYLKGGDSDGSGCN